jgi:2-polyprenyl-3-methyl-5-hydroxy-6-metoxy-1,4-benzoquinol methylase
VTVELSVVIPVYGNAATLGALHARVAAATAGLGPVEMVFVDDACPHGSGAVLDALAVEDPRVRVVHLPTNRGQHAAILAGLAVTRGRRVAVLDADLQDPPEALPALVERLDGGGWHAVFAGRRGRYSSPWRTLSGRAFRAALARLTNLPGDAGGYVVLSRAMADAVLALEARRPYLAGMVGATGLAQTSIPVLRASRPDGRSAYAAGARARLALPALFDAAWTWRRHPSTAGRGRHQAGQLSYYDGPALDRKRRMQPVDTPYVRGHVERVVAFGGIRPGDRVLDVGCGMGKYTLVLAAIGHHVEGLDLSPALLERFARADRFGLVRHRADLLDPPADLAGRYDVVTAFMALHHLPDLAAGFAGMRRLVRPGGRIVLLEPNGLCPLFPLQITLSPTMSWRGDKGVLSMRPGPIRRAAEAAGLVEVEIERVGICPPRVMNSRLGPPLERLVDRVGVLEPVRAFALIRARASS